MVPCGGGPVTTQKQIEANRRNARKGGPKTPEGKAVSRLNARKHGIFASALTGHDADELGGIYDEFVAHIKPVGPVETALTEMVALTYLRLQRCARAEAECHISTWEPKIEYFAAEDYAKKLDAGLHASWFDRRAFEKSVALFARYSTTLTNQFVKLLHELERLQRLRLGEQVAPPQAADLNVALAGAEAAAPDAGLTKLELPARPGKVDAEVELRNEPNLS